ncbi:hypothetical protein NUM_29590 [Actinocatenispora comari]|uniref:Uncharacterized protein n=1 Tax=Actinocatenispora comari TaxID=2807577 RepID=A0A8J4ABM8_9ACTN|nr:hypothetical protein NUM_29590 [Actinocatenispora comari]
MPWVRRSLPVHAAAPLDQGARHPHRHPFPHAATLTQLPPGRNRDRGRTGDRASEIIVATAHAVIPGGHDRGRTGRGG